MMNTGVAIQYGDIAPEAKENFNVSASEKEFDTLSQFKKYNLSFPNFANPCELYQTVLDGKALLLPAVTNNENLGLWSKQVSDLNGEFENPIVIELESDEQYSSQGLTLTFDTYNNIYATRLNIKWLRITDEGITELHEEMFYPDNAFYFCQKYVANYNKIIITFYSVNMPNNRLKLRIIDYGYGTVFYGDELRNVKISQTIDPISSEIAINVTDFTLDSKSNIEYSFQAKQPLLTYFNGELKSTTFVKSSNRLARFLWQVKSEDYISLMNNIPYLGDVYDGKDAFELLEDIFNTAKVPYVINEALKGVLLYGHIPYTTCRNALMQVAFAVQNAVDTSDSDSVKVFALKDEIKQTVPLSRIMQGQAFTNDETVTGVEVAVHTYEPKEAIDNNRVLAYNARELGTGENIFVRFDEPLHSLYTVNGGEIIKSTANYAVINVPSSRFRLIGYGYEHTSNLIKKKNPVVLNSEIENTVTINNATLVSFHNIDNVIEKCYAWLAKTNSTKLKIVEGRHITGGEAVKWGEKKWGAFKWGEITPKVITYDDTISMGECIGAQTEYLGEVSGRLIQQTFNLNGNTIIKEAVLK